MSRSRKHSRNRSGQVWIEVLLVVALIALILQLFPAVGAQVVSGLDPRSWPRSVWFALNLLVVIVLVTVHGWPSLLTQRHHSTAKNSKAPSDSELEQQKKLQAERELYARTIKARQKQV